MRAILLATILPSLCFAADRGIVPADYYKEITPGELAISPNGSLLAFTVTTVVEKDNKRHREIWMQDLANAEAKPFRFTSPEDESSSPVWSPDGSILSFQSKRGDDKNSTWFIRVTAPGGEAYHIEGVEAAPVWSPDGQWIAYVKREEDENEDEKENENENEEGPDDNKPKEDPKRKGWIAPDATTTTLDAKRFDGRVITTMGYKADGTLALMPHRSARKKTQLYVAPAAGGEATRLTNLPYDVASPVWTADSYTLIFPADPLEDDEYNEKLTSELYAITRHGGQLRNITHQAGSERGHTISQDGKRIAYDFTADRGEPSDIVIDEVLDDGCLANQPRNLTAAWDLTPGDLEWTPDGVAIRFAAGIGGDQHAFEVAASGGPVTQITRGERQLGAITYSDDHAVMAFTVTDALTPAEVATSHVDGSEERRVSTFNDEWLAKIARMPAERLTWQVADGTTVEGWIVKPVGFDPEKKYPMILKIHGGPHAAYGNTWFQTFHVLSSAGFFVLYTNPRGSTGYGHDFIYATRGRWGEVDGEDYVKGVDAAIAKYRQIDLERVGVSGGSYGGFMSAWLSATTDRFAVANPSRMISNWESWYGASDAQGLTEFEFFGAPWEERELYRKLSPLSHVENVTAPTLVIVSEEDYRTPVADGEQWYMALKKRQVPVELVRYPRSSHGLSRNGEPWLLVDRLERIRSWFVHWLVDEELTRTQAKERYGNASTTEAN